MHIFCCRIPCCFHVLLTNNAAVSTGGRGPVAFRCFCFSSDIYAGVDLLDHSSSFGFLRNLHIVFQSSCGHLPSHEQGSYSPCCLRGCTHSARGTWAAPSPPTSPGGWLCLTQAWAAQHTCWTARSQGGFSTRVISLPPSPPGAPDCCFSFLPAGCVWLFYSLGCKPFCSFPVTPQWDLFRCRCMYVYGARWVLAWGFLLCHSSRNSSYK